MTDDTFCTKAVGNTRPPPTKNIRSRKWCFTLNNWTEEEYKDLIRILDTKMAKYIVGKEIGEEGTPHLQGYFELINAMAFTTIKKWNNRLHIEKAKGNTKSNLVYCKKGGEWVCTFPLNREERILKNRYEGVMWRDWQQKIIDICDSEPDDRTIHWFWETTGNVGKSFLCKYLVLKYDAIICEGKKADIFNQIKVWMDAHESDQTDPKVILADVPRTSIEYLNYGAIEQIKNGMCYSGKYEGGRLIFDHPHVIVFANSQPQRWNLSDDRWDITCIDE